MMTLVRWDPFRELEEMSDRVNRAFARPALRNGGKEHLTVADWVPTVDIDAFLLFQRQFVQSFMRAGIK